MNNETRIAAFDALPESMPGGRRDAISRKIASALASEAAIADTSSRDLMWALASEEDAGDDRINLIAAYELDSYPVTLEALDAAIRAAAGTYVP